MIMGNKIKSFCEGKLEDPKKVNNRITKMFCPSTNTFLALQKIASTFS